MLKKILIALITLGILGTGLFISSSPLTRSALFDPSGANRQPKYFSIVKDFDRAKDELHSVGFKYIGTDNLNECLHVGFLKKKTIHIFGYLGWRSGTVCILERDGVVEEYSWAFKLGTP